MGRPRDQLELAVLALVALAAAIAAILGRRRPAARHAVGAVT